MLNQLVIENYRSCVRTSLDLHPNLSVLIGPNGSGKTNILQTIMLLNKLTRQSESVSRRIAITGSSRVKASFQTGRVAARLRVSFDAFKTDTGIEQKLEASQRWLLREQNGQQAAFEVPLAIPSIAGTDWPNMYRRQYWRKVRRASRLRSDAIADGTTPPWAAGAVVRVSEFCRGIKYYSASQFTDPGSSPVSFEVDEDGTRQRIVRYRGRHERVLYDMYSAKRTGTDGRYDRFINIVGPDGLGLIDGLTFRSVRTSSATYSVRVGGKVEVRKRNKLLIIPQFRIGRLVLSPTQLSEGTFKTLALLFQIITEDSRLLLIEEPEVCVHQGLLSSILELLKTYSQRRQVIISTHSDYVLDHVEPENVYSVSFNRKVGTLVRHIPKSMNRKEFSALKDYLAREGNLGEYWREGGLGDLS